MRAEVYRRVKTPDRVHLATDIWRPDGPGRFPAVLVRTPYGRAGCLALAQKLVERGYAVVVQDVRGKYDSEGTFRPLVDEATDGHAAVDWVANQRWCNGRIGLYGQSYLGIVQVPAASGGHEALRCILPAVAPASFFTDWVRYDGCFALANMVRWPLTHAVCPTKPALDHVLFDDLHRCASVEAVLERFGADCPALREWVAHDRYDDYWQSLDQHLLYENVRVPGLHGGGWFDHITRGQYDAYIGIGRRGAISLARENQRLLIGPWGHMTYMGTGLEHRRYGQWDFGEAAQLSIFEQETRFLDRWLRDIDSGLAAEPPVRVFVMGDNRWAGLPDWPPPQAQIQDWHLHPHRENRLSGALTLETQARQHLGRYRYEPDDPAPTLGGNIYWGMGCEPGPQDQRPLFDRCDMLLYRSAALDRPLTVLGEPSLRLWFSSSAPDTDVIVKLCVVERGGAVTVLSLGSLRCRYRESFAAPKPMAPGEAVLLNVRLNPIGYTFPSGSRVALLVTSSCFPRILPHPNTMAPTWCELRARGADQTVWHGGDTPSRLALPVVDRDTLDWIDDVARGER